MKTCIAILLLFAFFFGGVFYARGQEDEEEGWLKALFPVASKVREAIDGAVKGAMKGIEGRIMAALIPETGLGGGPQIGFYYPQLKAVNSHLGTMGSFHEFVGGFLPAAALRYSITPEFQIGYTGAFMSYSTTGRTGGDTYITGISLKGQMHTLSFVYKPKLKSSFRFYVGAEAGGAWVEYMEDSGYRGATSRKVKHWSGSTFAVMPFLGFQYRFDRIFALGVDYGYVFATIQPEGMKPLAGTSINDACPQVDLSGSILRFGPQIHF